MANFSEAAGVKRPSKAPSTIFLTRKGPLEPFFAPSSVAVIGATEKPGSVGRTVFSNLIQHPFGGLVLPVNPKRTSVLGVRAYPTVSSLPDPVDLALVVVPASACPRVVGECGAAGIPAAIVISAGFKEAGAEGVALEKELLEKARGSKVRVLGPNCFGVMSPVSGLNATFASAMALSGNIAFVSQSGALCAAVLDWSLQESVGFSAFVSMGSMADVGWGDVIDYLGDDPRTKAIVVYMESIGDARSFVSAAREVALTKPVVILKAGRTQAAAKAASSHTGALAGNDEVLDAAFRRCGVLRVRSIAELFAMAHALAKQPRPAGPRLSIVTNAGGPGVLATDELVACGGSIASLSAHTLESLNAILPLHWSHGNPIDVLGDADPDRYAKALAVATRDPGTDGLLVILTPQAMSDPTRTAEQVGALARSYGKPVLASWMGGPDVAAGEAILSRADIATFTYPEMAARVFTYMWQYSENLRGVYETPILPSGSHAQATPRVRALLDRIRCTGRCLLTESESKQVLAAYDIPVVDTRPATTEQEAVAAALSIGYPVAIKVLSTTVTHKTDVGGVELDVVDEAGVVAAFRRIRSSVMAKAGAESFAGVTVQKMIHHGGYELIVGSSIDPSFGPVLLFGSGGELVEIYADRALALPPLTTTLARRLMERTKVFRALRGVRGRAAVDLAALEALLVRFSWLIVEQPWIKDCDVNPLLASPSTLLALDARILLHDAGAAEGALPRPAIRAYPAQYASEWVARDGTRMTIRPIRPEDEPAMVKFHGTLSDNSVYLRYFGMLHVDQRTVHERLTRMCFIDYDRAMALVATQAGAAAEQELLGIGRLTRQSNRRDAEFALLVTDRHQGKGLGTELLSRLVEIGRREKLDAIDGDILAENLRMQRVCERAGLSLRRMSDDGLVRAHIDLRTH